MWVFSSSVLCLKRLFSPLYCFCSLSKISRLFYVGLLLGSWFCPRCLPVFFFFGQYHTVLLDSVSPPTLSFFFSVALAIWDSLPLFVTLESGCQYTQNNLLGFWLACVESIAEVEKYWHFDNIESSCPWTWKISNLFFFFIFDFLYQNIKDFLIDHVYIMLGFYINILFWGEVE